MTPVLVAARLRALADAIEELPVSAYNAAGDSQTLILGLQFAKTPPGIVEAIRREFASAQPLQTNQLKLFFDC